LFAAPSGAQHRTKPLAAARRQFPLLFSPSDLPVKISSELPVSATLLARNQVEVGS
jgi:hypothetical protein